MFKSLIAELPRDKDYPARQFTIDCLTRVLDGTLYDHLQYSFYTEQNEAGEYVKLKDRRPSSRSNLCRVVVDNSVSLLFSEGHFPTVDCDDRDTALALNKLIKEIKLNQTFVNAATVGSVGSVAIFLRIIKNRVFVDVMSTQYLTPVWQADAPDTLQAVQERFKVKGADLKAQGYTIADDDLTATFWYGRDWTDQTENHFLPLKIDGDMSGVPDSDAFKPDLDKTVSHNLGFVPVVWVKNLPNGDNIDGGCTFKAAIDTMIEIDYLMSQGSRGLRYSSDPTLVIKDNSLDDGNIIKGGGNALKIAPEGDAKMLEINGSASVAMEGWIKMLREQALESIHGNKASNDKVAAAQSGRAMELLNQALIWVADKLRISYGEGALLDLLNMIVLAADKHGLVNKKGEKITLNSKADLSLRWAKWYSPTATDRQADAVAVVTLTEGAILSQETATKAIADEYDIEDVTAERALVDKESQAALAATQNQLNQNPAVPAV